MSFLNMAAQKSIIQGAGGHYAPYGIIQNVSNAASVMCTVLRGVSARMKMDILWQTWIIARDVGFAHKNAGQVQ